MKFSVKTTSGDRREVKADNEAGARAQVDKPIAKIKPVPEDKKVGR